MVLIHNKEFENIAKEVEKELNSVGFSTTPGSIAKLFADIINKNIAEFYEVLSVNHVQAFLTTATGQFLDSIGILLNCTRRVNEDDETFRRRISNQVLSLSKANETSIRLAVLSIEGVKDMVVRKYTLGPGSYTVIPVCENDDITLLSEVETIVKSTCSLGERVEVKKPKRKKVKLDIGLHYSIDVNDTEKQILSNLVRKEITNYINSLRISEPFIINELTERIMKVDSRILDYSCNKFSINNQVCLFINQGAMWDEQFKVSEDLESINII